MKHFHCQISAKTSLSTPFVVPKFARTSAVEFVLIHSAPFFQNSGLDCTVSSCFYLQKGLGDKASDRIEQRRSLSLCSKTPFVTSVYILLSRKKAKLHKHTHVAQEPLSRRKQKNRSPEKPRGTNSIRKSHP